jgi:hypothetical protein
MVTLSELPVLVERFCVARGDTVRRELIGTPQKKVPATVVSNQTKLKKKAPAAKKLALAAT